MDKSRKKINRFYSASFFLIAILILVFMGVLLYIGYSSQLMIKKQSPQIRTIGLIELEITTAHLWLEEVLSGDRGEDIQAVYSHFEEANKYASILLDGGKVDEMQVYLVEDSTVRSKIEAVQLGIDSLFKLSGQRFLELGETQAGTETDKIYDAVFGQFIQIAKISERALIQQQQKNTQTFIYIQKTLIFSVIIFSIIILAFFFWFERFKINKHKQLVQSDKELTQSEGRWQFALESSRDGVWDWNAQTNKVFFSKRWKEMLGFEEHEISDSIDEWDKRLHPDDKEKCYLDLNKHFDGETDFYENEHRVLCKDGSYKWILDRGKVLLWTEDKKPLRVIGTHIDLTDRKRAEEDLMTERGFSKKIIETSSAIIVGLDKNHLIRIFNKGAEEITGYSKAEVLGKDWFKIFFPDEIFNEMNKVWKEAWGTTSHSYENQILIKNGEQRIISWQTTGVYEGEKDSEHLMISIGEDTTERKKTEDALRESQTFNQTLLDTSPDLIYVYDIIESKNIYSNKGIVKILGYSIEEIQTIGENLLPDLMHPDDFDTYLKDIIPSYQTAKDGEIIEHEYRMKHKNGHWCWLNSKESIFMRQDDGLPQQIFGITSDITERKNAGKTLLTAKNKLESIFRAAPTGIGVVSNRIITEVNQQFCDMMGYKEEELLGKESIILYPSKEEFEWVGKEKYEQIKEKGTGTVETKLKHKDGHTIDVLLSSTPLDLNDLTKGVTFTALDISQRKNDIQELENHRNHLEDLVKERTAELEGSQGALLNLVDDMNAQSIKLEKSNKALASINEELETFTYSVSHDLKAPLRGIDGYSQLLLDTYYGELNKEAREFLSNIRHSTQQMSALIEDLLAYSRMERQDYRIEKVHFKALVDNLLLYYSKTIKAQKMDVKLSFSEAIMPIGDKDGMNLVMRNLLDNAIKFTSHNKKAQIEIGASETDSHWLIFVKDSGVGFDMKYHDKIFKIFHRLHLAEEYEGTGIGLAMVSKAAQRMNGKIWAESEIGKGATFYLEIRK